MVISFFVNLWLLWRTLVRGIRDDAEFRSLIILLASLLIGGTVFYWQSQGWTILDSLYFCVMTVSTVGYGDFVPATEVAKVFTIVFTILGIGLFASFVGKLVALRMQPHANRKEKRGGKNNK